MDIKIKLLQVKFIFLPQTYHKFNFLYTKFLRMSNYFTARCLKLYGWRIANQKCRVVGSSIFEMGSNEQRMLAGDDKKCFKLVKITENY